MGISDHDPTKRPLSRNSAQQEQLGRILEEFCGQKNVDRWVIEYAERIGPDSRCDI